MDKNVYKAYASGFASIYAEAVNLSPEEMVAFATGLRDRLHPDGTSTFKSKKQLEEHITLMFA